MQLHAVACSSAPTSQSDREVTQDRVNRYQWKNAGSSTEATTESDGEAKLSMVVRTDGRGFCNPPYPRFIGRKAYPDGCASLYSGFGGCFVEHPQTDPHATPSRTVAWPGSCPLTVAELRIFIIYAKADQCTAPHRATSQ